MKPSLTPEERDERLAVIDRALTWLEGHPENYIHGALAREEPGGVAVSVANPDATCFCALGRIAYEAKIDDRDSDFTDRITRYLGDLGIHSSEIVRISDRHTLRGEKRIAIENLRNYMLWGPVTA